MRDSFWQIFLERNITKFRQKFRVWSKELSKCFSKLVISITLCQQFWSNLEIFRIEIQNASTTPSKYIKYTLKIHVYINNPPYSDRGPTANQSGKAIKIQYTNIESHIKHLVTSTRVGCACCNYVTTTLLLVKEDAKTCLKTELYNIKSWHRMTYIFKFVNNVWDMELRYTAYCFPAIQRLSRSSFYISTTWWLSMLVDQWVPEGTCSQVLWSTSVDS